MQEATTGPSSPGQAIYDELSDEAKKAVDALPASLFGVESDFVKRCVTTIRQLAVLKPTNWALLIGKEGKDRFYTNVTMNDKIVLGQYNGVLSITCEQSLLSEETRRVLERLSADVSLPYKDREVAFAKVPAETIGELPTELWDAHSQLLERFATITYAKSAFYYMHRDDGRVKLAMLTGEDVPHPSYVPRDLIGQPMQRAGTIIDPTIVDIRETLDQGFSTAGLKYTDAQIASFYTALQTKGFVILSGISGTGKSKIAQRFAEMLPDIMSVSPRQLSEASTVLRLKRWPYMAKYKRFVIPKSHARLLPKPDAGTSVDVQIVIDGSAGEGRIGVSTPGDGLLTEVHLKRESADRFGKLPGDHFFVDFELKDEQTIGKVSIWSELPLSEAKEVVIEAPNHLFLPVRPDWRDGKALIGYHNPLSGEYVRTDFLEFVLNAADDYRAGNRNAFLVILDEMNLAHVEYYFADVLSVIESGRDSDGWTVEGIPLAVGEEDADLPERLHLPPNLYVVGTVNMDETTHPFSPKVLDRAFTIELTEVDFAGYPPPASGGIELGDAEKQALLNAFTQLGRYPRIDKSDIHDVVNTHGRFRADLQSLNTSLRRSRMHFGYRVFDEITQFVFNAKENGLFSVEEAFDHAVLMKVLPKFNGSRGKLHSALLDLIIWSRQTVLPTDEDRKDVETTFEVYLQSNKGFDDLVKNSEDWRYPATGKRAALMMQDLYTEGFASFG